MVWHEIYVRMWLRYQLNAFNFNSYLCRETENDRSTTCTGTKTFSSVKCHMLLRLQHQLHCGERGVHQAYTTIAANMCCTPSPRYVEAADWFRFVFAEPFLSPPLPLSLHRCKKKLNASKIYITQQRFIDQKRSISDIYVHPIQCLKLYHLGKAHRNWYAWPKKTIIKKSMKAVKNRSAVSFFSAKPEMCQANKKNEITRKDMCVRAARNIFCEPALPWKQRVWSWVKQSKKMVCKGKNMRARKPATYVP